MDAFRSDLHSGCTRTGVKHLHPSLKVRENGIRTKLNAKCTHLVRGQVILPLWEEKGVPTLPFCSADGTRPLHKSTKSKQAMLTDSSAELWHSHFAKRETRLGMLWNIPMSAVRASPVQVIDTHNKTVPRRLTVQSPCPWILCMLISWAPISPATNGPCPPPFLRSR